MSAVSSFGVARIFSELDEGRTKDQGVKQYTSGITKAVMLALGLAVEFKTDDPQKTIVVNKMSLLKFGIRHQEDKVLEKIPEAVKSYINTETKMISKNVSKAEELSFTMPAKELKNYLEIAKKTGVNVPAELKSLVSRKKDVTEIEIQDQNATKFREMTQSLIDKVKGEMKPAVSSLPDSKEQPGSAQENIPPAAQVPPKPQGEPIGAATGVVVSPAEAQTQPKPTPTTSHPPETPVMEKGALKPVGDQENRPLAANVGLRPSKKIETPKKDVSVSHPAIQVEMPALVATPSVLSKNEKAKLQAVVQEVAESKKEATKIETLTAKFQGLSKKELSEHVKTRRRDLKDLSEALESSSIKGLDAAHIKSAKAWVQNMTLEVSHIEASAGAVALMENDYEEGLDPSLKQLLERARTSVKQAPHTVMAPREKAPSGEKSVLTLEAPATAEYIHAGLDALISLVYGDKPSESQVAKSLGQGSQRLGYDPMRSKENQWIIQHHADIKSKKVAPEELQRVLLGQKGGKGIEQKGIIGLIEKAYTQQNTPIPQEVTNAIDYLRTLVTRHAYDIAPVTRTKETLDVTRTVRPLTPREKEYDAALKAAIDACPENKNELKSVLRELQEHIKASRLKDKTLNQAIKDAEPIMKKLFVLRDFLTLDKQIMLKAVPENMEPVVDFLKMVIDYAEAPKALPKKLDVKQLEKELQAASKNRDAFLSEELPEVAQWIDRLEVDGQEAKMKLAEDGRILKQARTKQERALSTIIDGYSELTTSAEKLQSLTDRLTGDWDELSDFDITKASPKEIKKQLDAIRDFLGPRSAKVVMDSLENLEILHKEYTTANRELEEAEKNLASSKERVKKLEQLQSKAEPHLHAAQEKLAARNKVFLERLILTGSHVERLNLLKEPKYKSMLAYIDSPEKAVALLGKIQMKGFSSEGKLIEDFTQIVRELKESKDAPAEKIFKDVLHSIGLTIDKNQVKIRDKALYESAQKLVREQVAKENVATFRLEQAALPVFEELKQVRPLVERGLAERAYDPTKILSRKEVADLTVEETKTAIANRFKALYEELESDKVIKDAMGIRPFRKNWDGIKEAILEEVDKMQSKTFSSEMLASLFWGRDPNHFEHNGVRSFSGALDDIYPTREVTPKGLNERLDTLELLIGHLEAEGL